MWVEELIKRVQPRVTKVTKKYSDSSPGLKVTPVLKASVADPLSTK